LAAVSALALIVMVGLALAPRSVLYPVIGVAFLLMDRATDLDAIHHGKAARVR
jgi:hypothetical protein